MTEEMARVHGHHAKLKTQLAEREGELRKAYKGAIPADLKAALAQNRRQIEDAEARNQEAFKHAQERLFHRLFHEAFHAYLLNFVYPARRRTTALAQRGAAQDLRDGHFRGGRAAHRTRRQGAPRRGAAALAKNTLLPLSDLLRSGPKLFQVAHDGDKQVSDRYYLASWRWLTISRSIARCWARRPWTPTCAT